MIRNEIGVAGDKVDRVRNRLAHPLLPAFAPPGDCVGRILETLEHLVQHREVELLLGRKMMQQRRRLDPDSLGDVPQAGAAIAALGEQRLRHLQHAVTRINGPSQLNHPGAGARG